MISIEQAKVLGLCVCRNCEKIFAKPKASNGFYCSNVCQANLKSNNALDAWKAGLDCGYTGKAKQLKPFVRRYMLEKHNYACQLCGWNERHPIDNLPLVEVDHIDGDAANCIEENLRVLCPNHHAMTETHRARNKNSARSRSIDGDVPDL